MTSADIPMETMPDTDRYCIGLTQLSSREQLSALMDGMLPEDQTRFLLRRLRHDAELAASWERWRIASDVMRGLAPARHLPADFALRVAAALREQAAVERRERMRVGRRYWYASAALLAALALLPAVRGPTPSEAPGRAPALAAVSATPATAPQVHQVTPVAVGASAPADASVSVALASSTSARKPEVAVQAARGDRGRSLQRAPSAAPVIELAQRPSALEFESSATGIGSRPWPRRILPQYGEGDRFTVGFGELAPAGQALPALLPMMPSPAFLQQAAPAPAQRAGSDRAPDREQADPTQP